MADDPKPEVEMVTIPKSEYDSLLEDSAWLGYLEAAGVDNWGGYDYARELQREEEGDEDE